ncbi:MAG: hypothetical protein JNJ48_06840 [Phycisphaerae bacterium]|nr:hypothetical protein [Phycisphaerae bacterium]
MNPPRTIIVGAGAIGATIALALKDRAPITVADADPAVRRCFEGQGVPAIAPDRLRDAEADLAVIATRAAALPAVLAALPIRTAALCVANGLNFGAAGARPPHAAPARFGCVDFAADAPEPGRPRITQPGRLVIPDDLPGAASLAGAFGPGPVAPLLTNDAVGHVWSKAVLNASLDPAAALCGRTIGGAFAHRPAFLLIRRLLREAVAVARAVGVTLHPVRGTRHDTMIRAFHAPLINRVAAFAAARQAAHVGSTMLADLRARRPTECPYLCGAIAAAAAAAGRAELAPTHRRTDALFAELLATGRPPTDADLRALLS